MRIRCKLIEYTLLIITTIILLAYNVSAGWWNRGAQCEDILDRGYINIFTFNILFFSESYDVRSRIEPIVQLLNERDGAVDVIFLQEVVGGSLALSEFTNSAKILKDKLSEIGLEYNLRTAFEVGIPGVFYTGNSILSRCEIMFSMVKRLPRESEVEILGRVIKLPRNVQMARLKIPGFGKFNAYNTHLCAFCNADERGGQLFELFNFIDTVETFIPGENPILLASDFNIDRFRNDIYSDTYGNLYDWIIREGFVDTYAESSTEDLNHLCEDSNVPDIHCTFGASAYGGEAGRIDYIFGHGFERASYGKVFFNPVVDKKEPPPPIYPPTSDHSAVLVSMPLNR